MKYFLYHCPCIGFQQKARLRLKMCLPVSKYELKAFIVSHQVMDQRHAVFLPQDPDHRCVLHFQVVVYSTYSHVDSYSHYNQFSPKACP